MEIGYFILSTCRHCSPSGLSPALILKFSFITVGKSNVLETLIVQVNCYSLNAVGPTVEKISGPKRFLTVYFTSAIASNN